jgi:hypothetical protein
MGGGAKIGLRRVRSSFYLFLGSPHGVPQVAFLWTSTLFPPLAGHTRIFKAHCSLPRFTDLDEMSSPAIVKKLQPSESAGFLNSCVFYP